MNQRGAILLLTVLVLGSVAGIIVTFLLVSGIDSGIVSSEYGQSANAESLAEGCAEMALENIRTDNAYSGTTNTTINNRDCSYEVINTGGSNRTINAQASIGSNIQKIQVLITAVTPQITVSSWEKVDNF